LHIQEVLNVLDAAFQTHEVSLQLEELGLVNAEFAHRALLGVVDASASNLLFVEDEFIVEHRCHLLAQFLAQTVDQDLFRFNLGDTHEHLVQDKHALREHGDLVRPFCQLKAQFGLGLVAEQVFADSGFELVDVRAED